MIAKYIFPTLLLSESLADIWVRGVLLMNNSAAVCKLHEETFTAPLLEMLPVLFRENLNGIKTKWKSLIFMDSFHNLTFP